MRPKRKEDKKHDEDIDISTLPQWITAFMMVEWDPSLSEIASLFPSNQFTQITRADLFSYAKEKSFIANNASETACSPQIYARALSEKTAFLDLQGRKTKKDVLQKLEMPEKVEKLRTDSRQASSMISETLLQPIDASRPDRIYLLLGFPRNADEIAAMGKVGCNVHFYFYIKSESTTTSPAFLKTLNDAVYASEKNSPLRTFLSKVITYDIAKYQGIESEMIKIEEAKLERNDTTQEADISKLRSSRTIKKQPTKDVIKEEAKEVLQAPDVRKIFINDILKTVAECGQYYIKYLIWKEVMPLKPLFPSNAVSEGNDAASYAASSVLTDVIRSYQDLPSLDDAPKPWDFRVFYYLFMQQSDLCAGIEHFIMCALQHLTYSEMYLKNQIQNIQISPTMINGAELLCIDAKETVFHNCEASEYYKKLFELSKSPPSLNPNPTSVTEISYFFDFDQNELDRMLIISAFESMILSHTGKSCTIQRNYSENISKPEFISRIDKLAAYDPEMISSQHIDGSLLLAIFFDSSSLASSVWEHTRKIRPLFQEWKESQNYPSDFYDIDELKIGPISSQEQSLYPCDGSVLRSVISSLSTQKRCYVVDKDVVFGFSENFEEWWYNHQEIRVRGSEGKLTCTCASVIIRIDSEILQELAPGLMEKRVAMGGQIEVNRVFTGKGTVIRYLQGNKIQILFANGNISEYSTAWVVTNNKGIRTSKGKLLEPIPCATVIDPETMNKTTFREDGTNIFYFPGKTVVEFADGTKILTTDEYYLIESPCYAPVKICKMDLSSEILLTNGFIISKNIGIKVEKGDIKITYEDNVATMGNYTIKLLERVICTTDTMGNYYQIGYDSEPKQVINQKSAEFSNNCLLFIVKPDGEAVEILDDAEVRKRCQERKYFKMQTSLEDTDFECYLGKGSITAHDKGHLVNTFLHDYKYPNVFCTIKSQVPPVQDDPSDWWIYRYYEKFPEFTQVKRDRFNTNFNKYLSWKKAQTANKEFGFSDFSLTSFEIHKNCILKKQNLLKSSKSSNTDLKSVIENYFSEKIALSVKSSMQSLDKLLEPSYSPMSPKIKKSKRTTYHNSSIESTLPSVNYFKSPEGVNLSLESSIMIKSTPKPVPSHSRTPKHIIQEYKEESPFIVLVPQKGKKVKLRPVVRSSCFAQIDRLQDLKEISDKQISEEYHHYKSKDFDVFGSARKSVPLVQSLRNTSPKSRINTKYVLSETLTDKRVRTVSQTHMPLTKVPNAQTFRRESNPIRNNPTVLNEYISDPFRRVLEITPAALDFGDVLLGEVHSLKVVLRNEDSLLMRFLIKQPKNPDFKVIFRPGPIAPGMVSKLIVELACRAIGEVKTEFEVYCKSEIYTVNITANIVGEESEGKHERIKGLVRKVRGNALPALNKSIA